MPRIRQPLPQPLPEPEPLPVPDAVALAPRWRMALATGWAPPITDLISMTPLGQRVAVIVPVPGGESVPGPAEVDSISISRRVDGNTVFRDWYNKTFPAEARTPRQGRVRTAPAAGSVTYTGATLLFNDERPGGAQFAIVMRNAWAHDYRIEFVLDGSGAVQAVETLGITMERWRRMD
jgi:hypothetical protein